MHIDLFELRRLRNPTRLASASPNNGYCQRSRDSLSPPTTMTQGEN